MKLMIDDNIKGKKALDIAGCDFAVGSTRYNTLMQTVRRAKKSKGTAEKEKKEEAKVLRQQRLLKHKFDSVQQHRHEANRCLQELEESQRQRKKLQKRFDELKTEAATASTRYLMSWKLLWSLFVLLILESIRDILF